MTGPQHGPHWLDDGAVLIVLRGSPLDAIAGDAYRLNSERPIAIAGIAYDVVGMKMMPADTRCRSIHLRRQGAAVRGEAARMLFGSATGEMSNGDFRSAMAVLGYSLDEMARRLGISRHQVSLLRKDRPLPLQVALAVQQLLGA